MFTRKSAFYNANIFSSQQGLSNSPQGKTTPLRVVSPCSVAPLKSQQTAGTGQKRITPLAVKFQQQTTTAGGASPGRRTEGCIANRRSRVAIMGHYRLD
jgi:hypothetical protein